MRTLGIALGIFVAAFIVLAIIVGPSKQPTSPTSTGPDAASPTTAIATLTPEPTVAPAPISWREVDSIYNLRSNNTDLQKDEEWKRFKGKRVIWSGIVSEISEGWAGLTLQVKMNRSTLTSDLLIDLKPDQKAKAARLHQGERVRFSGMLDSWGSLMPITLTDGEIIE